MKTPPNPFKAALKQGKPQIGIRSQLCSPIAAEIMGTAGFDFIYLDMEHPPSDAMLILHQLQALAGTPAQPMVKLPLFDQILMQRLADMGTLNFVVPMVQSAEDAKRAIRVLRYPPLGIRGAAGAVRANRFGDYADYFTRVHDELCLIMQVETREAVGRTEEIAAVDGVDAILFGPADIAADLGHLGQSGHPDVKRLIADGIKRITAAGKWAGMSSSEADGKHWLDLGCTFITVGGDTAMLAAQTRALAAKFKSKN